MRRAGGRLGASYSFNYDLRRDTFLQQRYTAYYNAQCCGVAVEYQTFDYGDSSAGRGISEDKRFNLSFTLAGIGTFSNIFGAFGGQEGRWACLGRGARPRHSRCRRRGLAPITNCGGSGCCNTRDSDWSSNDD